MNSYDVMYQEWLIAKKTRDFKLADKIRDKFERIHGLTIFAEGVMPIEGITVRPMTATKWHKKFGDPKVAEAMSQNESKFCKMRVFL